MKPKTFYIAVKGIIISDGKALVLQKYDQFGKQFWDIPGGRMDDGETIEETLERELREEVLNIKDFGIMEFISMYLLPRNLKDGNGLFLLFYRVESSLIDPVDLSEEHNGYKWITKAEVSSLDSDDCYIESGYKHALQIALK